MSGAKGRSGRRRKATAQFRGETWVRLSHLERATVNGHTFDVGRGVYWVDSQKFTDYASAAAEFVRSVNGGNQS